MRPATLVSYLCAAFLAACGDSGTGSAGPSWFRASLAGEVTGEYEGTGDFASLRDEADSPRHFMIFSEGSDPAVRERFYLRWPDAARPGVGAYALVPYADRYGSAAGVTGVFMWMRGDNVSAPSRSELYVATEGSVEITRSTSTEVEGTIRFSGTLIEKAGPSGYERLDPRDRPDPAAPRVEVTGTFRAKKWEEDGIVVIPS